ERRHYVTMRTDRASLTAEKSCLGVASSLGQLPGAWQITPFQHTACSSRRGQVFDLPSLSSLLGSLHRLIGPFLPLTNNSSQSPFSSPLNE
ncbi:hypothetical protein PENTCL1PPCAC_27732, partial [Pristionchus entomophagus]